MIAMHAAVWSQPVVCHTLRRSQRTTETPVTLPGRTVLGVGIALTVMGGILTFMGITGYFMTGDTKYFIAFGSIPGLASFGAGLLAIKAVGHTNSTPRHFILFMILAVLSAITAASMAALGIYGLIENNVVIISSTIAVTATSVALVISVVSGMGIIAGIYVHQESARARPHSRCQQPSELITRYRPSLVPSAASSVDTTVSHASDPEG